MVNTKRIPPAIAATRSVTRLRLALAVLTRVTATAVACARRVARLRFAGSVVLEEVTVGEYFHGQRLNHHMAVYKHLVMQAGIHTMEHVRLVHTQ